MRSFVLLLDSQMALALIVLFTWIQPGPQTSCIPSSEGFSTATQLVSLFVGLIRGLKQDSWQSDMKMHEMMAVKH